MLKTILVIFHSCYLFVRANCHNQINFATTTFVRKRRFVLALLAARTTSLTKTPFQGISMLKVRDLKKTYSTPLGANTILDGINLDLEKGQSLALMGESGSGKSTLLHLVGGLDVPDSGSIMLGETNVATQTDSQRAALRQKRIGVIFQQFNLIPSLTVEANLSFQARIAGCLETEWQEHLIETLGLGGLEKRYPEQLSGGQQQRVAIGRTLAAKPDLILADEPTGNLDETTGDNVLALTLALINDTKSSLLLVTHNSRLADQLNSKTTLTNGRISG